MKESIEKFCNTRENGLFLLDMPTGFGKTSLSLKKLIKSFIKYGFEEWKNYG